LLKTKLLFVIFSIIFISNAHCQIEPDDWESHFLFTSSYSLFFSENQANFSSFSVGPGLLIMPPRGLYGLSYILELLFSYNIISFNYQYSF